MSEAELYPPVRDWLTARGYEVHVEIFDSDIVAVRDGLLTVVELKACLSMELFNQCQLRARWADFVYAAVGSNPNRFDGWKCEGFGVLTVQDGKVRERRKPKPQPWHRVKAHAYRLKMLTGRAPAMPHELAGLPSCPELKQQRLARTQAP